MLVVTVKIEGAFATERDARAQREEAAEQRGKIHKVTEAIWKLEGSENLRWLFITDDDLELNSKEQTDDYSGSFLLDSTSKGGSSGMRARRELHGMRLLQFRLMRGDCQLDGGQLTLHDQKF